MNYKQRIQELCDEIGIDNPIQETDLNIEAISFLVDNIWIRIDRTDMNRGGRLFFQCKFGSFHKSGDYILIYDNVIERKEWLTRAKEQGKEFFGELWEDAEEKGRSLITALKQAEIITIHWKD